MRFGLSLYCNVTRMICRNLKYFRTNPRLFYVVILLGLAFLPSCYPEWKVAKSYIASEKDVSIMILPADYVFKRNLKIDESKLDKSLEAWEVDSSLMASSLFLRELSDSVFLETFVNSMIMEFEMLGYTVYTENMLDSFLFIKSPAYIFNIAQIELEEHFTLHEDEESFGDYVYYKKVDLNAISYNFWFEVSELNDSGENTRLFYASETINDVISGYFAENIFTGEIKYKYNVNEIDMDVIYRYSEVFAKRFAGYTYDFLMNQYMEKNWPASRDKKYYMHYKRENNTLDPTWDDKFIEMDE